MVQLLKPVSPIVMNIFMFDYESRFIFNFSLCPCIWFKFVADIFATQKPEECDKWNGSVKLTSSRAYSNKDRYLDFSYPHPICTKVTVVKVLQ